MPNSPRNDHGSIPISLRPVVLLGSGTLETLYDYGSEVTLTLDEQEHKIGTFKAWYNRGYPDYITFGSKKWEFQKNILGAGSKFELEYRVSGNVAGETGVGSFVTKLIACDWDLAELGTFWTATGLTTAVYDGSSSEREYTVTQSLTSSSTPYTGLMDLLLVRTDWDVESYPYWNAKVEIPPSSGMAAVFLPP